MDTELIRARMLRIVVRRRCGVGFRRLAGRCGWVFRGLGAI